VRGPQGAELLAAGGQLPDELGELAVVGAAGDFGAQLGHDVGGDPVPVGVEVGGPRVEERVAGVVRRAAGAPRCGVVEQV
jgi:hypothetical protein